MESAEPLHGETEKPTGGFQLPRSALRWVVVGLSLTTSVVILISLFSGVTPQDLAKIG
jgi:hypothetical protein